MEAYQKLEHELAEWIGTTTDKVVVCSSGTAALHLALEALQLSLGSEVLVPDYTMVACARAVAMAGLPSAFVDCKEDLLIDPDLAREASVQRISTRVLMPVHIYGRQCNMSELMDVAIKYDLLVVEDMAEAHGIKPHPHTDAACWSFYKNKIVAGEEGGAIAFREVKVADRARSLRSHGFTEAHDFTHVPRGHNYRMANCLAEKARESLPRYVNNIRHRRVVERWYDERCPEQFKMPTRQVPWVYDLRIPNINRKTQDQLVLQLQATGVQARYGFKPISSQEEFSNCRKVTRGVADRMSREVIYLPLTPSQPDGRQAISGQVTEEMADRAFEIIRALS